MYDLLINNRAELIERCEAKVAQRPPRATTPELLKSGIPHFLEQLARTLQAEAQGQLGKDLRISGGSVGGPASAASEMGMTATIHGKQLLELGYAVDDVVHGYGDLCQAICDLAVERDAPFKVEEFRTLNRCLDNVIAEAVTAFTNERDNVTLRRYKDESNERLGFLLHELRNSLHTATLALAALESGRLSIAGATGGVLRRSLAALTSLVKHALDEVSAAAAYASEHEVFSLASFVGDAGSAALLDAGARGCSFIVRNVIDPEIVIKGDRELLFGALMNLIQNTFKFTQPGTEVSLCTRSGLGDAVFIDVEDHCGGLAPGVEERMFQPFTRGHADKSGMGLGLSIAKQNVQTAGGSLSVQNVPGTGCIFTIGLRRHGHGLAPEAAANRG